MTFRGQIDVLVHFESFRNVDLYHQGMYFLKSTLYHKRESKVSQTSKLPQDAILITNSLMPP